LYLVLILALLVLVSLILIGYPIWKGHGEVGEQAEWMSPTMEMEKDTIMGVLSEIEFDYHMKKLSEDDYRSLKNKYAKVALAILDTEDTKDTEDTNTKGDTRICMADAKGFTEIERNSDEEL